MIRVTPAPGHGHHESGHDPAYPSSLVYFKGAPVRWDDPGDTLYLFAVAGTVEVADDRNGRFPLRAGMYACLPSPCVLSGGEAVGFQRHGFRGLFSVGGPVEKVGRLRYIDGCSDTLLVPPPKLGDPCLNHLHFPPGIDQTAHTHPSCRLGVVVSGRGECVTPRGREPLVPGTVFAMPPETVHKFRTGGDPMDVVAWHPDSDCGPTDDDHPMIRRTIVEGVPAHLIPAIRTREIGGA